MITLKVLKWGNMFCYGEDNSLDFTERGAVTQITGQNGVGKSSINLVLEELLFNKNSRGIKKADIPNRDLNATTYWASLTFSIGNKEYFLSMTRAKTAKVVLTEDGEDISSHTAAGTYKQIIQLLGEDFNTFSQKIYQGMSSSLQFLTSTDAARKKFLVSLLDLESYGEYHDELKDFAKGLSGELAGMQNSYKANTLWLERSEGIKDEPLLDEEPPVEEDYSEHIEQISTLKGQQNNIELNNKLVKKRNTLQGKIDNIDVSTFTNEIPDTDLMSECNKEIATLRDEYNQASTLVKKLGGLKNSCPTCLSDLDNDRISKILEDNKNIMDAAKDKRAPLAKTVADIQSLVERVLDESKQQKLLEQYEHDIEGLPEESVSEGELTEELAKIQGEMQDLVALAKQASDKYTVAIKHNSKIKTVAEEWEAYSEKVEKERKRIQIATEEAEKIAILKKAFSPSGIVALRIEKAIKSLENDINTYLKEFCNGRFSVHFILESDKLNVKIQDRGIFVGIQALSSGQLARVTISTVLAIRKLMSKNSNNSINLLFLDEITATLDQEGKDQLIEIILKETELNAFIILHGWQHPLVPRLEVLSEDAGSYITESN